MGASGEKYPVHGTPSTAWGSQRLPDDDDFAEVRWAQRLDAHRTQALCVPLGVERIDR